MTTPAVLVIGGGLTGLQAAASVVEAGARAIVLEQGPVVGGKRAAWLGSGELDPGLATVGDHAAIEVLTLAEVQSLSGEAGDFTASVNQRARFVTDDCSRCNHCVPVCPQVTANEYDAGLTFRKAIHSPLPEARPPAYVIDIGTCLNVPPNYLPCQRCVEVCDDNAIHFDMPRDEIIERRVAAVVVATGFACDSAAELAILGEFGYGRCVDVLSSVELQRLLEDPGPSGGFAIRPSDEAYPDRVLLVLTRVSADAAWVMSNQVQRLAAQDVEHLTVLVLAQPDDVPELDALEEAVRAAGANLCWGTWNGVDELDSGQLRARYTEFPAGRVCELTCDLVVLSSEVQAGAAAADLADTLGLALDEQGYLTPSRSGVYVAGGARGTVGIEKGAEQARAAVAEALRHLEPEEEQLGAGHSPSTNEYRQQDLERMLQRLFELGAGQ